MGSGQSLTHKQVVQLIKRDLIKALNEDHQTRPRYTDDGIEIFYDFSDEVRLNKKIKNLELFVSKEEIYNLNLYSIKK
jgi:hypothetical protein